MQISVTFRHMEPSDTLRSYIHKRIYRVKKYIDEPTDVNITLLVEKFRHIAEITIFANTLKLNACEEAGDVYKAIDGVINKIEKQIKKYRKKVKRSRYSPKMNVPPAETVKNK